MIAVINWLNTNSEWIQGLGSILAVLVSIIVSYITCLQNNKQLAKAEEELVQSKYQNERESAKKVSAWYAGGADKKNANREGIIISNLSETPIYNVFLALSSGGETKSIALLPPGMWFFEKREEETHLGTDKWKDPVQLVKDLESSTGYCFWEADGAKIPVKTIVKFSESDVTLSFRDNNGRNWKNENGDLKPAI